VFAFYQKGVTLLPLVRWRYSSLKPGLLLIVPGAVITLSELLPKIQRARHRFNVLALGSVQTEMLEEAFPGYQAPISEGMAIYF
jgi:hypothetical protein